MKTYLLVCDCKDCEKKRKNLLGKGKETNNSKDSAVSIEINKPGRRTYSCHRIQNQTGKAKDYSFLLDIGVFPFIYTSFENAFDALLDLGDTITTVSSGNIKIIVGALKHINFHNLFYEYGKLHLQRGQHHFVIKEFDLLNMLEYGARESFMEWQLGGMFDKCPSGTEIAITFPH